MDHHYGMITDHNVFVSLIVFRRRQSRIDPSPYPHGRCYAGTGQGDGECDALLKRKCFPSIAQSQTRHDCNERNAVKYECTQDTARNESIPRSQPQQEAKNPLHHDCSGPGSRDGRPSIGNVVPEVVSARKKNRKGSVYQLL